MDEREGTEDEGTVDPDQVEDGDRDPEGRDGGGRDGAQRVTLVPTQPGEPRERWAIDWSGAAVVVLVAVVVVAMWQWLGGSSDAGNASDRDQSATSAPIDTVEEVGRTTTLPPTTTTPPTTAAPTTSTIAPGRQVLISGEMKPCQFGANCLVAHFTIEGFDEHPGRFVCIYPNSRRDFGFNDDGVDDACLTADAGDTITIEVDGVQSKTISEQDLDGSASAPEND